MGMKHASTEERKEHYAAHNHRPAHDHSKEAAKRMDTRSMQCSRKAYDKA